MEMCGPFSYCSEWGPVVVSCEDSSEPSDCTKGNKSNEYLNECKLHKKDCFMELIVL